jgi:hypothetical protein
MMCVHWRKHMSNKKLIAALPLAAVFAAALLQMAPASAAGQEGMVVARDPQTGQLRAPTAAEMQALAAQRPATLAPPAPPKVIKRADGSRQARVGETGMVYAVVTRDADGHLAQQCVQGEPAASAALARPAAIQHEERRHEVR